MEFIFVFEFGYSCKFRADSFDPFLVSCHVNIEYDDGDDLTVETSNKGSKLDQY